ncbi:MAG: hypothetical protein ABSG68_11665 [Thermoguttaceae bacterium]
MVGLPASTALWVVMAVQVIGLGSAWIARAGEGSHRQKPLQNVFAACLVLVGLATVFALGLGPGCWLSSGTTFSIMVLTVTGDPTRTGHSGDRDI